MQTPPSVNIARLTYLLICEVAGIAIALSTKGTTLEISMTTGVLAGLGVALFVICIELLMKGFTLRGFSTATFGLGVGLFCAWLLTRVQFSSLLEQAFHEHLDSPDKSDVAVPVLKLAVDVTLYASLGFLGAVLSLRGNRDDFAFIIPYVRFRQDASSGQPIVLDPESVIDGRWLGILKAGFLRGRLIVPRFVLDELQTMVTSTTLATRQQGQKGLDFLDKLQKATDIQISIHDEKLTADKLNGRLIEISRMLGARLMTLDENLSKIAKLQGVEVLNIHELDEALKAQVAVGQRLRIALVRTGKEDHQGVGYLPDGTMIVVNHAVAKIGTTAEAVVLSTLQTNSGTMVFAELYSPRESI